MNKKRFLYIFAVLFFLTASILPCFALQDLSVDLSSVTSTGVHEVRVIAYNGSDTSEARVLSYDNSATYTVTYNLTNMSVVGTEITTVRQGDSLMIQFESDSGYALGGYTFLIGGENKNSFYNPRTNIFYIDNVQGNVLITMTAYNTDDARYQAGYNDGQFAGKTSILELFPLILGSVSGFFMSTLGNMNVMGISILSVVALIMLAVVVIFILKAVIK